MADSKKDRLTGDLLFDFESRISTSWLFIIMLMDYLKLIDFEWNQKPKLMILL